MPADLQSLLRLEVPVIVVLAERKLAISQVRALAPGSIIELDKGAEEDLEFHVHNRPIGMGRALRVGGNYGIRMTSLGQPRPPSPRSGTVTPRATNPAPTAPSPVGAAGGPPRGPSA
jgi:flagellar motor switch protein FliN/FliY